MDTWGNQSNLWIPCVYYLLDQGIPVDYELDTFNTPHTGTTFVTPKIGYVDAMHNPAPGTKLSFHIWATLMETRTPLPQDHQTHKNHGDSKVYFLQRQTWLSLHPANILPSHVQQHTLLSQLSHDSITSLCFFPFPWGLQHKSKLNIPCCQ